MNIALFLLPKAEVAYLHDTMTVRRGLDKLRRSGYAAIPVIDSQDKYVGAVSEGDFLWSLMEKAEQQPKQKEQMLISDIVQQGRLKPVCIDTDMEELFEQAMNQNFVPVIDDRNVFIGIITRKDIIKYLIENRGK